MLEFRLLIRIVFSLIQMLWPTPLKIHICTKQYMICIYYTYAQSHINSNFKNPFNKNMLSAISCENVVKRYKNLNSIKIFIKNDNSNVRSRCDYIAMFHYWKLIQICSWQFTQYLRVCIRTHTHMQNVILFNHFIGKQ